MKHISSNREEPRKPRTEDVYYEVTVAAFNKEKGEWEEVSTDIGLRTASFIESQGNLELFRRAQPGDILEFTEKGVYKKKGEVWERAFTAEESKKELPTVRKVMRAMAGSLQRALKSDQSIAKSMHEDETSKAFITARGKALQSQVVMQVKVVKGKLSKLGVPDTGYIDRVKKKQPELAKRISQELQALQLESTGEIEKKKLDNLLEAGKVVITPKYFAPAVTTRILDKGAVKEVHIKSNDPKHVFYTAISNLFKSVLGLGSESELLAEVKTAENIVSNLNKKELLNLLKKNETIGNRAGDLLKSIEKRLGSEYVTKMFNLNDQELSNLAGITLADADEILRLKDQIPPVGKNLMVDLKVVEGTERIQGKLTVQAPRAVGNLDKEVTENAFNFEDRESYCLGLLSGMADMHDAGYVHGDLKLENVLMFEDASQDPPKRYVKISDFGKTRALQEDQKAMYLGNPRFAPYEGKLSMKGEMVSTALMMIRVLEEGLEPNMLLEPENKKTLNISDERKGVERYVVMSAAFPNVDASSLEGKVRVLSQRVQPATGSNLKKAEEELHDYIKALGVKLKGQKGADPQKIDDYVDLLTRMTHLDPNDRPPSMREAYNQFVAISSR